MLTSEYDDDSLLNVAADQSEELLKLHQLQLKLKNRELIDTRRELSHLSSKSNLEKVNLASKHQQDTASLQRQLRDAQDTLRLRDAEIVALQNTLQLRSDDLEKTRNELVESREQARRAEQQAYDAKVHYKTKSDQLAREHKRNAVHFHEQLTGAFEKKMQKLKLKHTQDLFTLKKTGGSRQ